MTANINRNNRTYGADVKGKFTFDDGEHLAGISGIGFEEGDTYLNWVQFHYHDNVQPMMHGEHQEGRKSRCFGLADDEYITHVAIYYDSTGVIDLMFRKNTTELVGSNRHPVLAELLVCKMTVVSEREDAPQGYMLGGIKGSVSENHLQAIQFIWVPIDVTQSPLAQSAQGVWTLFVTDGGSAFNDGCHGDGVHCITLSSKLFSGEVTSIAIQYRGDPPNASIKRGGDGWSVRKFKVRSDDYIDHIRVYSSNSNSSICGISFFTNGGMKYGPYGNRGSTRSDFFAPRKMMLGGIRGNANSSLYKLSFCWVTVSSVRVYPYQLYGNSGELSGSCHFHEEVESGVKHQTSISRRKIRDIAAGATAKANALVAETISGKANLHVQNRTEMSLNTTFTTTKNKKQTVKRHFDLSKPAYLTQWVSETTVFDENGMPDTVTIRNPPFTTSQPVPGAIVRHV